MATTGIQDVAAGFATILTTYRTANPTLLRGVWLSRPGLFGDLPLAWVEVGDEDILHTSGTRQRTLAPTITVVDTFADNEQTSGRLNVLQDGINDALSAGRAVMPNIVWSRAFARRTDIAVPSADGSRTTYYRSIVWTFADVTLMEGRP